MKAIIVDDEPLARNELRYLLTEIQPFEQISEAETIQETLELLLFDTYDVVFLDINLMDESGLDMASKINQMANHPHIIFATAHDNFAVKAFELNATDYILKPFEKSRIEQALAKITPSIPPDTTHKQAASTNYEVESDAKDASPYDFDKLPVEMDDRIHLLNTTDIIAISVNNGVTTINTTTGDFETTQPLSHYEQRLNDKRFIRIHRATIINRNYIQTIDHWFNYMYQLTMMRDLKFQVSRSYMKRFKQQFALD